MGSCVQRPVYSARIACYGLKVGARSLVGLLSALLPITQRSKRNPIPRRELFLRETKRAADDLQARRRLHPIHFGVSERLRVRICKRRGVALFRGHSVKAAPIMFDFHCDTSVVREVRLHGQR